MADTIKDFKFATLQNPETCSIEELQKQIIDLDTLVGFYETKQLAIKKFINSVYGALGSKYFVAHNTAMAESITAQGRDLNHFSENSVNAYFKGIFQSNPKIVLFYQWVHYDDDGNKFTYDSEEKPDDYYMSGKWEECKKWAAAVKKGTKLTKETMGCLQDNSVGHCDWFQTQTTLCDKLGIDPARAASFDISKGKTTETGELTGAEYEYLDGTDSLTVAGDTDSIVGDSLICVDNEEMKIEDAFIRMKYENMDTVLKVSDGSEVVPVHDHVTKTFDENKDKIVKRPIKYIMRHKVSKPKYKITTDSGKEIIVTGDHSCMVIRNGNLMSIKAHDINVETDKVIVA